MEDINSIKEYLTKLSRIVNTEVTLNLFKYRLISKTRIDDTMCCIYAKLPDKYKKILKSKSDIQRYNSVLCYGLLAKLLTKRFFLDPSQIIIDINEVNKLINAISKTIERDIHNIEEDVKG